MAVVSSRRLLVRGAHLVDWRRPQAQVKSVVRTMLMLMLRMRMMLEMAMRNVVVGEQLGQVRQSSRVEGA